jgi:hypothetical protein
VIGEDRASELWLSYRGTISKEGDPVGALLGFLYDLTSPSPEGTPLIVDLISFALGLGAARDRAQQLKGSEDPAALGLYFGIEQAREVGIQGLNRIQQVHFKYSSLTRVSSGQINIIDYGPKGFKRIIE